MNSVGLHLSPICRMNYKSCFPTQALNQMPAFHPILRHAPWFCEEVSRRLDEPECSLGPPGPSSVRHSLPLLSLPLPTSTFSPPPSLPKNMLMTPAITDSFQCLAPHLNHPPVPLYHKTTPKSSCRAVYTPLPPPPDRSRSGFCHQHSTENMPLKIPSLPNWPARMGFSSPPPPHELTLALSPFPS